MTETLLKRQCFIFSGGLLNFSYLGNGVYLVFHILMNTAFIVSSFMRSKQGIKMKFTKDSFSDEKWVVSRTN